jgi:hypothetical protein
MNTKITTALGLIAGFIGGAMSHYLFVPIPVHAQAAPVQPPAEIRAQKFVLVDEHGTPHAVLGFRSDGTPELQAKFGKPKGLLKFMSAEIGRAGFVGIEGEKNVLPELRTTHPPKTAPPNASE